MSLQHFSQECPRVAFPRNARDHYQRFSSGAYGLTEVLHGLFCESSRLLDRTTDDDGELRVILTLHVSSTTLSAHAVVRQLYVRLLVGALLKVNLKPSQIGELDLKSWESW